VREKINKTFGGAGQNLRGAGQNFGGAGQNIIYLSLVKLFLQWCHQYFLFVVSSNRGRRGRLRVRRKFWELTKSMAGKMATTDEDKLSEEYFLAEEVGRMGEVLEEGKVLEPRGPVQKRKTEREKRRQKEREKKRV